MTELIRARDLIGLPVVSIATGEDVAEVRDVVYDAAEHSLIGFTLNKRGHFAGRMSDVLPASAVAAVGADAVMVADDASIGEESGAATTLEQSNETASVLGNRVLTSDGAILGEVIGVVLIPGTNPEAVGYEVRPDDGSTSLFVPITDQVALSGENLLLPAGATDFARNDLAGFGEAVATLHTTTEGD